MEKKIKNRKTYLIYQLGLGCLILLALLVIYPKAEFIYAFIGIGLYLFGLEIGRREGYIKAYKNLPEYDYGYIERWKKIRNIDHEKSNLTDDEAYNNQRKTLKGLDFPLSGDDSD